MSTVSCTDVFPCVGTDSDVTGGTGLMFRTYNRQEHNNAGRVLIFVETKKGCDALTRSLRHEGWPALSIHGDKSQVRRVMPVPTWLPSTEWVASGGSRS